MNLSNLNLDVAIEELLASGKAEYPADHKAGMRVPQGGSDCAKCEYVRANGTECANKFFQKWHGSNKLPEPADEYCCDWFEASSDLQATGTSEGAEKGWEHRIRHAHGIDVDIFDRYARTNPNAISVRSFLEHDPPSLKTRLALAKAFLSAKKVGDEDVDIDKLTPLQNTVFKDKVEGIRTAGMYRNPIDVFRYKGKQYVIDGHHRLAVWAMDQHDTIPAHIYEMPKELEAGGPGSGCNPEVGKCGRPSQEDQDAEREKGEALMNALKDWQAGSHYIRLAAKDVLQNKDTDEGVRNLKYNVDAVKDAKALLDEIRNGTTMTQAIYRGVSVMDKTDAMLALKEGDEFQLPMQSFTKNVGVAHGFAIGKTQGDTHVIFQVDPGAKVLDLSKEIGEEVYHEVEVITNGKFKVTGVEDVKSYGPEPYHVVHVQHMGVF